MPGPSKVIVLDPDARSGRQIQLGFQREGVSAEIATVVGGRFELPTSETGLVVVGGQDGRAVELVKKAREALEASHADAPIVFAGRGAPRKDLHAAGADEVLAQPAYLRDVVTIGRLLVGQPASHRAHLVGNLAEITGVLTLVRALSSLGRSAVLTLIRGLRRGEVRFYQGEVTSAQVGLIHGQAAFHQLLLWTDCRFDFHHEDIVRRQQIPLDHAELFADADRFLAGVRDSAGELSPSMVLEQDVARIQLLGKQIPTEVHAVLRMFDGHRVLADVLEDSPYRVFETLRVAQRALDVGLLRKAQAPRPKATWRAVLAIEEWLVGAETKDDVITRTIAETTVPVPRENTSATGKSKKFNKRQRKKRRENTPIAVPEVTKGPDIDWGALVPRSYAQEVGPLSGVVPTAQQSGEITLPRAPSRDEPREKLESLTNTTQRDRIFPADVPSIIFDDSDARAKEEADAKAEADRAAAALALAQATKAAKSEKGKAKKEADAKAKADVDAKAKADAEKAEAQAKARGDEARAAAAAALAQAAGAKAAADRAKADAAVDAKAKADADARAADAKSKADADARAAAKSKVDAERDAAVAALAQAARQKAEADAKAKVDADARATAVEVGSSTSPSSSKSTTTTSTSPDALAADRAKADADARTADAKAKAEAAGTAADAKSKTDADARAADAKSKTDADARAADRTKADAERDAAVAALAQAARQKAEADAKAKADADARATTTTTTSTTSADARAVAPVLAASATASAASTVDAPSTSDRPTRDLHAGAVDAPSASDRPTRDLQASTDRKSDTDLWTKAKADAEARDVDARRAAGDDDVSTGAFAKPERDSAEAIATSAFVKPDARPTVDAHGETAAATELRAAAELVNAVAEARPTVDLRAPADKVRDLVARHRKESDESDPLAQKRAKAEADKAAEQAASIAKAAEAAADAARAETDAKARAEADARVLAETRAAQDRSKRATNSTDLVQALLDAERGPREVDMPSVIVAETPMATVTTRDRVSVTLTEQTARIDAKPETTVSEVPFLAQPIAPSPVPFRKITPPTGVAVEPWPLSSKPGSKPAVHDDAETRPFIKPSAPQEIDDAPSDGVIRERHQTAETQPEPVVRRPPPGQIPKDDRPALTTGEIRSANKPTGTPPPATPAEPSILVNDLQAAHSAASTVTVAPRAQRPPTQPPPLPPEVQKVQRDATGAFSQIEEEFFRSGQNTEAVQKHFASDSFDDLDEGFQPVGFWDRLLGRKKPKK